MVCPPSPPSSSSYKPKAKVLSTFLPSSPSNHGGRRSEWTRPLPGSQTPPPFQAYSPPSSHSPPLSPHPQCRHRRRDPVHPPEIPRDLRRRQGPTSPDHSIRPSSSSPLVFVLFLARIFWVQFKVCCCTSSLAFHISDVLQAALLLLLYACEILFHSSSVPRLNSLNRAVDVELDFIPLWEFLLYCAIFFRSLIELRGCSYYVWYTGSLVIYLGALIFVLID